MPLRQEKPIALFGRLDMKDLPSRERFVTRTTKSGQRVKYSAGFTDPMVKATLEFDCPDLEFAADESEIARMGAETIVETIRENALAGLTPSGTPLPPASPATIERRRYRAAQAARGGAPAPRANYNWKPETVKQVQKNFDKRFRAKTRALRDRGPFTPSGAGLPQGRIGIESGLMFKSAVAAKEGKGFRVFFADVRALLAERGRTAVERVFSIIAPWSMAAMRQPRVQERMRGIARALIRHRGERFGQGIAELAGNITELADTVSEGGTE